MIGASSFVYRACSHSVSADSRRSSGAFASITSARAGVTVSATTREARIASA